MRVLLVAILLLQSAPTPAQTEADRIEAALKRFGERKYRLFTAGKETGTLVLKARIESGEGRKGCVLEGTGETRIEDEVDGSTIIEHVSLSGLRLVSTRIVGRNGKVEHEATIKDGRAPIQTIDGVKTIDVTDTTVGFLSMLLLPSVQDQKEGAAFKVDVLSGRELQKGHEFACLGKETIEIAGKKHEAFKWRQKGEGKIDLPNEPIVYKIENCYWVSPEGVLLRQVCMDKLKVVSEFVLDSK